MSGTGKGGWNTKSIGPEKKLNSQVKGWVAALMALLLGLASANERWLPAGGAARWLSARGAAVGRLIIYTSLDPEVIAAVKPELARRFPGLRMGWHQAGSEQIVARLSAEVRAGRIMADLLMVSEPSYYVHLKKKGLLLRYISPHASQVAAPRDPGGYWTSVRISHMVIAYNKRILKANEAPRRLSELTRPVWNHQVLMPNPLLSGTAFNFVAAVTGRYGWGFFEDLRANRIQVEGGNSAITRKLLSGEFRLSILNQESVLKAKSRGEPLEMIYPEDAVVMIPGPIAILRTSRNPAAAKAVYDWWLSRQGQQAIVNGWMHSVRRDLPPPAGARPLPELLPRAIPVDWEEVSANMSRIKDTFSRIVLEQ